MAADLSWILMRAGFGEAIGGGVGERQKNWDVDTTLKRGRKKGGPGKTLVLLRCFVSHTAAKEKAGSGGGFLATREGGTSINLTLPL